jgi:hypothetical protein
MTLIAGLPSLPGKRVAGLSHATKIGDRTMTRTLISTLFVRHRSAIIPTCT